MTIDWIVIIREIFMFCIEIAGLLVEIDNQYEEIRTLCRDYIVGKSRKPDICVAVPDRVWKEVLELCEVENPDDHMMGEMETYVLHGRIYPELPRFDAAWLHASVVEVDGEGYAFTAPSGYGKTTQARLWLDYFGPRARIINGDNPIIRFIDGGCFVYGTPFGGKEGYQCNTRVPLKGICFLDRSEKNVITRMEPEMAFTQIIRDNQKHLYLYKQNQEDMMSIWEKITEQIPIWQLQCNRSSEAVEVAYGGINGINCVLK